VEGGKTLLIGFLVFVAAVFAALMLWPSGFGNWDDHQW
jgi:hypothetical protein